MVNVELKRGDIFCTRNNMWIGRAINATQRFWSADNQSEYSHAGIIVNSIGETFESLWTIRFNHIDAYAGQKMLIGRATDPTATEHSLGIMRVAYDHKGQVYPVWRLIFHLFPPMAKYISSGRFPVCSELTVKKEIKAGVKPWGTRWQGKNPDMVADAIHNWDAYEVVYEGMWEKALHKP